MQDRMDRGWRTAWPAPPCPRPAPAPTLPSGSNWEAEAPHLENILAGSRRALRWHPGIGRCAVLAGWGGSLRFLSIWGASAWGRLVPGRDGGPHSPGDGCPGGVPRQLAPEPQVTVEPGPGTPGQRADGGRWQSPRDCSPTTVPETRPATRSKPSLSKR